MPSETRNGQVPLIIEGNKNVVPSTSSSGLSVRQAGSKSDEVPPTNVINNTSESCENPEKELLPSSQGENRDDGPHPDGPNPNDRKRKKYHRHTPHQIKEMEAFFKVCPHPDDNQRKQLSRDLGLDPLQVKFWFQNKHTQMKTYLERADNARLRAENEKLRAENMKYKEALAKSCCPNCGGPQALSDISRNEQQLRLENAQLREEVEHITSLTTKFDGTTYDNFTLESPPVIPNTFEVSGGAFKGQPDNTGDVIGADELLRSLTGSTDFDKPMIFEIAVSAVEEVVRMSEVKLPLWIQTMDLRKYVLNEDAYYLMFPGAIMLKQAGLKTEASRETDIVKMNPTKLVEVFADTEKWLAMFSSMVSRAYVLEVISVGVEPGNRNGALEVISAEFQVLTPTVPTREFLFIRHCKQLSDSAWAVVDISCDSLFSSIPLGRCQKRPSGCIIEGMPNGCSKVTWIEHVEVDDQGVHYLGKPFVDSGLAFGAQRWVAVLSQQCDRLANTMVIDFPPNDINDVVLANPDARKNILRLSERMVLNFYGGVTSSNAYSWINLYGSGNEETRIMTKNHENDPKNPSGTVLNATTCFWLPVPQKIVFEFLRDENSRNEWDILSNGGDIQKLMHITNSQEAGNCVTLMRVSGSNLSQGDVMILQECTSNPTASSIIYAPVDIVTIKRYLGGENPDHVVVLPSGFTIFPSGAPTLIQDSAMGGVGGGIGSLVTLAFQILVDSVSTTKLSFTSISVIKGLVEDTKQKIKAILAPNSA